MKISNLKSQAFKISQRPPRASAGWTLIEIMVVMLVIGILAAVIVQEFGTTAQDAKVSTAKANIAELDSAVTRFYLNMDRYPAPEEGLKVLVQAPAGEESKWRGPYINLLRSDPWGNPYQYQVPGTRNPNRFDIWSRGADGTDGGEGANADVGNW